MGCCKSVHPINPKVVLGKRKRTPPCSRAELFFAEKNGVYRGKISVVDIVFLVFIGFLYPPPAWKVFLLGEKSSPKDFLSVAVVYAFFFSVVIFFSLTEAPLPDPNPTPPNTLKRTRNGPETEPKRSRNGAGTEPKWTEIKLFGVGRAGGLSGRGGGGVVREKENHYPKDLRWAKMRVF